MAEFKVTRYIRLNMSIMTYLGYLRPQHQTGRNKVLYELYTLFGTLGLVIIDLATSICQVFNESDIEKATSILFVFLAKVILLIKIIPILKNQQRLLEILHENRPDFHPFNYEQRKIFEGAVEFQKKMTVLFHSMGILATLAMRFFPFIDDGMSGKLFAAWYYAYQTVCLMFMSLADVATDMLISGLMMVVYNQLQILCSQIVGIKDDAVRHVEKGLAKNVDEAMRNQMVFCINHYNHILEFANDLREIFSGALFFLFFLGVGATGLTLFQFVLTPIFTVEFFSIAIYQACVLLEIFLYCFYGNLTMAQSDSVTSAIYQCGWEDGSLQFKKDVNKFMIRTQKPYRMYAGGFFLMSLPNFVLILKWSWSYFTLLHRLHEKRM